MCVCVRERKSKRERAREREQERDRERDEITRDKEIHYEISQGERIERENGER